MTKYLVNGLHIFALILIIFPLESWPWSGGTRSQSLQIYADEWHKGLNALLDISHCANVPSNLERRVTAVDTKNRCARFYSGKNCTGQSMEMLAHAPSHHDLSDYSFNNKMMSAGPCRDSCSVPVTGPPPPPEGLNITVFDRKFYKGASALLNIRGCTLIPRKLKYRVMSVNTTGPSGEGICVELFNNVDCYTNKRIGDSIELRPGTPFHDDISRWNIEDAKAISHCSYKCLEKKEGIGGNGGEGDKVKGRDEVILYDDWSFKGNKLRVQIGGKGCVNLDQFWGWEGAARSIRLEEGGDACVRMYKSLDCEGEAGWEVKESVENLAVGRFSEVARSLQGCGEESSALWMEGQEKDVAGEEMMSKVSSEERSSFSFWIIIFIVVIFVIAGGMLAAWVVGRRKYPGMNVRDVMQYWSGGNRGGDGSGWGAMRL